MKVKISYSGYDDHDYRYVSETHTIILPEKYVRSHGLSHRCFFTRYSLYYILHEIGHAHYVHHYTWDMPHSLILKGEIEAWEYAYSCLKSPYKEECMEVSKQHIATYEILVGKQNFLESMEEEANHWLKTQ